MSMERKDVKEERETKNVGRKKGKKDGEEKKARKKEEWTNGLEKRNMYTDIYIFDSI